MSQIKKYDIWEIKKAKIESSKKFNEQEEYKNVEPFSTGYGFNEQENNKTIEAITSSYSITIA